MPYKTLFQPDAFKSEIALITGGGTGIGRAVAHELANAGATVIIAARRLELLQKTAAELRSWNPSAIIDICQMDIKDEKSVQEAVKSIVSKYGKVSLLVNNAGGQFLSPSEKLSLKGFKSVVDLNLVGTWNVTKAVFDHSMRKNGGAIVSILIAMQNGFPMMAHSGAARAGVENMTKSLASEWGIYGVRLNSISSGTVIGSGILNYPREALNQALKSIPPKTAVLRLGTEAEIAAPIIFLLSKGASYITGTNLRVDGGLTLAPNPLILIQKNIESKVPAYIGFDTAAENLGYDAPNELTSLLDKMKIKSKL